MGEHGGPLSSGNPTEQEKEYKTEWPTSTTFRPTRTINVGEKDSTTDPFLQIHSGQQDHSQPLSWAALSHCWGGNTSFILTTSTLASWQRAIPLSSMPQTFQDAVTVTRNLGLKHLWIDSLCIQQDSPADWAYESARMADIYRLSAVHLAAHTSRHSGDGFLKARSPVPHVSLPFSSSRFGVSGQMLIRPALASWTSALSSSEYSVLSSRGWVLQESLLSPRTLHFGGEQVFWECPNLRLGEGDYEPATVRDPDARDMDLGASKQAFIAMGTDTGTGGQSARLTTSMTGQTREVWYMRWYQIVVDYTNRNLGYPSDIFPALSGLAQTVGALTGDEYMAGLFRGDAHRGLLWRPGDGKSKATYSPSRADAWRAPSWSWASVMGPVSFEINPGEHKTKHLPGHDVTVVSVSLHPLHGLDLGQHKGVYGALTSATLEVEGLWRHGQSWRKVKKSAESDARWDLFAGRLVTVALEAEFTFDVESESFDPAQTSDWALLQVSKWETSVPMCLFETLYALILRPVKGPSREALFRRVGLCQFEAFDEPLESVRRVKWERKRVTLI